MIDLDHIATLSREELLELPVATLRYLEWQARWRATARPEQIPPEGDWIEWGVMAGRGFGKTRVGAEWLANAALTDPEALPKSVIAPTLSDVRFTCFEGQSGLLSIIPPEFVEDYNKTNLIITLTNGGIIRGFGSESPERLRGPQASLMWADELAAWQNAQETWDMAMMGLRLGPRPQVVWTTTPKPIELVRKLTINKPNRVITRGATFDNKANLPQSFLDKMEEDFGGTTMGRQEILGELIDPEEAGIIKRSWFRIWPAKKPLPTLEWVIMSLDTAFTEATVNKKTHDADYSACSVWGVFRHEGKSNALLLDCWQEQLGLPDLVKRVKKELLITYGDDQDAALLTPMFGSSKPVESGKKIDMVIIEDKGSGISLRQTLEREGIMAYAYNPGRADKLTRLHMVSAVFARRQVWLPESEKYPGRPRTWAEPLVAQLCAFTGSGSIKHDDLVDSSTQAVRLMMDKNLLTFERREKEKERDRDEVRAPRKPVVNPYAV
jgi:predicted phage terminase large subunit-like protein